MRVSFHVSPLGPVTFEFEEIEVPIYADAGFGRFIFFDDAVRDSDTLDALHLRVSALIGSILDRLLLETADDAEARRVAPLCWYLGLLRRRRDMKAATDEAMRLMGLAVADDATPVPPVFGRDVAVARLAAAGERAVDGPAGLGVRRLRVTDIAE